MHGNLHHVVDLFRRRGRHRDLHWHSDVMDVGDGLVVVPWRRTLRARSRASLATNHTSTHGTPKAGELSAQQPRVLYWTLAGTRMGGPCTCQCVSQVRPISLSRYLRRAGLLELVAAVALVLMRPLRLPATITCRAVRHAAEVHATAGWKPSVQS